MSKLILYNKAPYTVESRHMLAATESAQYSAMLHKLRHVMPGWLLKMLDSVGRCWLSRNCSPYRDDVAQLAAAHGTGIYTLNTLFEWCCTTFVLPQAETGLPIMHRVLDWSLPIGEFVHTADYKTPQGTYIDINWAGNAGVINAVAPGRFVIAINQAPIVARSGFMPLDFILQRIRTWGSRALPPSHLVRQVMEQAADYDSALATLHDTPLCIPAIFTICGTEAAQAAVIERLENASYVMTGARVATANHWQNPAWRGHARPIKSHDRLACAHRQIQNAPDSNWLTAPIFNAHTVLAFVAAAHGLHSLQTVYK